MDAKTEHMIKAKDSLSFALGDLNQALDSTSPVESMVVLEITEAIATARNKLNRLMAAMEVK